MAEQARRLAQEASESKGRFLATLGHEVRTPMTGLLGMNALLLASELSPEQRRQAEAVRRSAQMMLRLVNEALDVARVEAGRLELLPQPVDLGQLLAEVIELQQPVAQSKGLQLSLRLPSEAAQRVRVDALRLQQILLNLLGNAIKFTRAGSVELRVEVASGQGPACCAFTFEVADTGPGLSEPQLAALFQPFAQADGELTARQHGGSGLGLYISRQLAEAMGGSVSAQSTSGVGSCFRLQLDLEVLGVSAADAGEPVVEAVVRAPLGLSVLLVEDHPDVAAALSGLLATWGCRVRHAAHALEALAQVEHQRFDVAVLDIDLPGLDGFELAGLLRGRVPRLLALSARSDAESEARALAAGFERFLRKPAEPDTLRAALREQAHL
jgi:CheY-like chemotaxis protein